MTREGVRPVIESLQPGDGGTPSTNRANLPLVVLAVVAVWLVAGAALPHGLPLGVLLLGLVEGLTTALTSIALVIVYRSARVINFAQVEIGGLAATLAVLLAVRRNVNYFYVVPMALALAVVTGAGVDFLIVRRFFKAPRLIPTVATVGLAQVLGAASAALPNLIKEQHSLLLGGAAAASRRLTGFGIPIHTHFSVGAVLFHADSIVVIILVPLVLAGLGWFFGRTDNGIGARAAADSQDRALMLGIPVRRLSMLTWMLAGGLSGLAALLNAGVLGLGSSVVGAGGFSGPELLMIPLAAAVIAKFDNLPRAVLASVGLELFAQATYWNYPRATTVDLGMFGVILIALLLQRRGVARVAGEELGGFVAVQGVRSIPDAIWALPEARVGRYLWRAILVGAVTLIPLAATNSQAIILSFTAIYAIIGVSLVVLSGWAGQLTLGQFAFVGIGAATTGSLIVHAHTDLLFALLASAGVGAILALIVGAPALRIPGLFLAPLTLAFAVAVADYALNTIYFPTFNPLEVKRPFLLARLNLEAPKTFYYFCLLCLGLAIVIVRNFRRSRVGRAVIGVRDNERMASTLSISPTRLKLTAFSLSGAIGGLAGGLYVLAVHGVPINGFGAVQSLQVFAMVVVGGLASISGGVLGAIYVYGAEYFIKGALQLFVTGAGILVVLLVMPGGLAAFMNSVRDRVLRWMVRRRGLSVPGFEESKASFHEADEHTPSDAVDTLRPRAKREVEFVGRRRPAAYYAGTHRKAEAFDSDATQSPALLRVLNLDAGYGHLHVLFDVDAEVKEGEVVALLGTNGAGKTTLLKVVAGLVQPFGGRVLFAGEDITHASPIERVRRGIVVVPSKAIFGSLTVRDNLRLAGWLARRSRETRELDTATDRVFRLFPILRERLDQRASLLSGGEQQMLALAQGMLCRPRLLLVDEMSLGLAPILVSQIMESVSHLQHDGVTVVVVEQSLNISTAIATRAMFMERGQIRFRGTPAQLGASDLLRSVFMDGEQKNRQRVKIDLASGRRRLPTAAESREVLSARGLQKRFGGVTAVNDLDLAVEKGEVFGIIGANGAGKTTVFDIISGLLVPDRGHLYLRGVEVTHQPSYTRAALGLGRTYQDVRMMPSLSTREVVAVALERHCRVREPIANILGVLDAVNSEREIQRRANELLDAFGLTRYADSFVGDLSTGTRRVLELACVAGHRPDVLLLDEPTSGLAQHETEAMAGLLSDFRDRTGATLMLIEHDVPLVASLSDRMMCMHLGKAISLGTPEQVLADPLVIAAYLDTDATAIDRPNKKTERVAQRRKR